MSLHTEEHNFANEVLVLNMALRSFFVIENKVAFSILAKVEPLLIDVDSVHLIY
jgi:hypothetical protein